MINIDLKSLINKLNTKAKQSIEKAAGFCMSRGHYNVEIEHWLIQLLEIDQSDLSRLLSHYQVNIDRLKQQLLNTIESFKTGNTRPPALSGDLVDVTKSAWILASVEGGLSQAGSAHILIAMLMIESIKRELMENCQELKVLNVEQIKSDLPTLLNDSQELSLVHQTQDPVNTTPGAQGALAQYTINLTERAQQGHIDPVLGRDQEIRQIIDILTRRRQNNPILTGEAGVGKTAVVEGFALRVVQQDVPEPLKNIRVHTLDLGLLQAGASVKGEFENRLKSVISEVKSQTQPIVIFIDEAHTMIGAGGQAGQNDAANLLKPALARGEFRTIAATTWAEYKKYFERDPALSRRFQVVKVDEPCEENAIDMMHGISPALETHHKVLILDQAIRDSVTLSHRYISGRQLPDKSVSVLDTACARVALSQTAKPAKLEDLERALRTLEQEQALLEKENLIHSIDEEKLQEINRQQQAIRQDYEKFSQQYEHEKALLLQMLAVKDKLYQQYKRDPNNEAQPDHSDHLADETSSAKNEEITDNPGVQEQSQSPVQAQVAALSETPKELKQQFSTLEQQLKAIQGEHPLVHPWVDKQAIAQVIANWTGIPVGRMLADEIDQIMHLQQALNGRVIGQDHALDIIARRIQTSRAGLTDPQKPIGVFLMVGPSGVGKTETAMALAEQLYGSDQYITVINMSEFKEEHKVSMLLGSPPGYVGYGEGGVLTEAVRRNPYSIVLLDEMEKAHQGVQDVFYQVFDKGHIKDGEGRDIDFKNTIIIMTSNAADQMIHKICKENGDDLKVEQLLEQFRPHLLDIFKPAFLGRTTIIPYYPLKDSSLVKICHLQLTKVKNRVAKHYQAQLQYPDKLVDNIVARCQEVDTGARNIESIINNTLLPDLASHCLGYLAEGLIIKTITIDVDSEGAFDYDIQ